MQSSDGGHGAHAALDLDLPIFYFRLCDLCLGCLDPTEFWHVGQLSLVGHHRPGWPVKDDNTGDITRLDIQRQHPFECVA